MYCLNFLCLEIIFGRPQCASNAVVYFGSNFVGTDFNQFEDGFMNFFNVLRCKKRKSKKKKKTAAGPSQPQRKRPNPAGGPSPSPDPL